MSKQPAIPPKATPPGAQQISMPLNDETWNAYIYSILPDDKLATSGALQPVYDAIGSGSRQRFAVLQKSDLMAWYAENIKLDICKEVKSSFDANNGNDNEIPDSLMAKLIKSRLLALKQEGIEQRNALRALAETPITPTQVTPDNSKGGAKLAPKEEKGRVKSADTKGKKPPAKGNDKKAPEPEIRPDSAANDVSKRKNKLRDKGGKNDSKIQAIGDEPADGPDVYYLLKDFNMGVLNALIEENDVKIQTIFRFQVTEAPAAVTVDEGTPSAPPSTLSPTIIKSLDSSTVPFLTSVNRQISEAYEWFSSAIDSSSWRNIAWNHAQINATPQVDAKEVFDAIAFKIYAQLKMRREFKDYYALETQLTIPSIPDINILRNDLRSFGNVLDVLPKASFLQPDVILGLVTDQVVRVLKFEDESNGMEVSMPSTIDEMGHLYNYFEAAIGRLPIGAPKLNESFVGTDEIKSNRFGDRLTTSKYALSDLNAFGINANDLVTGILEAYPSIRLQEHIKKVNQTTETESESTRKHQRLATLEMFRKNSLVNYDNAIRVHFQNQLEELLSIKDSEFTLNDWCWGEYLDRATLAQAIQESKVFHPLASTKFCKITGKLLVALAGEGGVGKKQYENESHLHIKTRVNFGLFNELMEHFKQYVVLAPKRFESRGCVYYSGDTVVQRKNRFTLLYPNDGSRITVNRERHLNYEIDTRISLACGGNYISWASASQCKSGPFLTASLENNVVISISDKDNEQLGTVVVSSPDGLITEFRQNGNIVIKQDSMFAVSNNENPIYGQKIKELSRVIMLNGTIIKYLNNSSTEVLFPDGTTSSTAKDNKDAWVTTTNTGARIQQTAASIINSLPALSFTDAAPASSQAAPVSTDLPPIRIAKETVISLKEITITREDMVVVSYKNDGSVKTEHADGTVIKLTTPDTLLIEQKELPAINISESGSRVQVRLLNGTVIEQTMVKNERAKYRVWNDIYTYELKVDVAGPCTFTSLPTLATIVSSPEYQFDWVKGTLIVTDSSGTQFSISETGECTTDTPQPPLTPQQTPAPSTQPASSSAQQRSSQYFTSNSSQTIRRLLETGTTLNQSRPVTPAARVNNPPKLFIVSEDGSGIQLLRDVDLIPYFRAEARNPATEILEERSGFDGDMVSITVIGKQSQHDVGATPNLATGKSGRFAGTSAGGVVSYRQLIRYPDLTTAVRLQSAIDISRLETILQSADVLHTEVEPTAAQAAETFTPPTILCDPPVLGQDRLRTQQEILGMYKLRREQAGPAPDLTKSEPGESQKLETSAVTSLTGSQKLIYPKTISKEAKFELAQ